MPQRVDQDARSLAALAIMHAQEGQFNAAERSLQQAVGLDPSLAELHNNLGMVLYRQRRMAEAMSSYQRALVIRPDYAIALNNQGMALAALNRHEEAITSYRKALAAEPGYSEALNNMGHHSMQSAEARKRLRNFRRHSPPGRASSKRGSISAMLWLRPVSRGRLLSATRQRSMRSRTTACCC